MSECRFVFPLLGGGRSSGLNNAGIETFKSNPLGAMARECAQNSLDAGGADGQPAELVFRFHTLNRQDIPGMADLRAAFEQCCAFWGENSAEYKFSDKALKLFAEDTVGVLEISDYHTTGLPGGDDEQETPWYNLVMSAGSCSKDSSQAGGFGIGKYAPFVLSRWRTVFYSSLTADGKYAFRGVCDNITHRNSAGEETQGVGYFGRIDADNKILSLRNPEEIPEIFRRREPGTSIFVLALAEENESIEQLKMAVLENFWPAIWFEKIRFKVGDLQIDKNNLAVQMSVYDDLKLFLPCLTSPDRVYVKECVGNLLGECELSFLLLPGGKRQEIVCTRSSRMKIKSLEKSWQLEGINFVGLFSCLSSAGNQILKDMEPPEHNDWDYKRVKDGENSLTVKEQHKVTMDIKRWIQGKISAQVQQNYGDESDMADVGQYFPDVADDAGGNAGDTEPDKNHDGFNTKLKKITVSTIVARKVTHAVDTPVPAGDDDGDAGDGGITDPGPDGRKHDGGGKGAVRGGVSGGGTGGDKLAGNAPLISFPSRSFVSNGEYVVVIRSPKDFTGSLQLKATGEDCKEKLEIVYARTDMAPLPVAGGEISKVSLPAGEPFRIYLATRDRDHFAVQVFGRETSDGARKNILKRLFRR